MANRVLFAGGNLDSVKVITGIPTENTSGAGSDFDSTYADCVLQMTTPMVVRATFIDTAGNADPAVDGERLYYHEEFRAQQSAAGVIATWRDTALEPWLRMNCNSSATGITIDYNSGTGAVPVWTSFGAGALADILVKKEIDVMLDINSAGNHSVSVYLNRVLLAGPYTWSKAAFTNVSCIDIGTSGGTGCKHSQILAAVGYSTVGAKVKYNKASGAGTTNTMSGVYTDINEAVVNDTTVLISGTAGQRATFAWGDVTVPANYVLRSVFQYVRGKNDGAAPQNLKGVVRSAGLDYDMAASFPGIGIGYAPLGRRVDTDPATATTWTQAGFNATEWGVLSVT